MDKIDISKDEVFKLSSEDQCEQCKGPLEGRVNRGLKRVVIFCRPCRRWSVVVKGKCLHDGTDIPEDATI